MPNNVKKQDSGFTLIETIIAIVVLMAAAVGLTSFLISIQYAAEDNLYESTAVTVALSTLEQMKSRDFQELRDMAGTQFDLEIGDNVQAPLSLTADTTLQVPVVTDLNSATQVSVKNIPITLRPTITDSAIRTELWLEVQYSYTHPRDDRVRTGFFRSAKNQIPTRRDLE